MYTEKIKKVLVQNPADCKIRVGKMPYAFNLNQKQIENISDEFTLITKNQEQIKQNKQKSYNYQQYQPERKEKEKTTQVFEMTNTKTKEEYFGELLEENDQQSYYICLYLNKDINENLQANIVPLYDHIKFNKFKQVDEDYSQQIDKMLKLEMKGKQQGQDENQDQLKRKNDLFDDQDQQFEKKIKKQDDDNLFSSESDKEEDEQQFIRNCKEYLGITEKKETNSKPNMAKSAQEIEQYSDSEQDNNEKYSESMDEDDDIFVEEFK